jgi:hypothetical protein
MRKRGSQIWFKIIAFIALTWIFYFPIKGLLSSIFLTQKDLDEVTEIERINEELDRQKGALWDVGRKDTSLSISYLPYPRAYDNVRTYSFITLVVIVSLGYLLKAYSSKRR